MVTCVAAVLPAVANLPSPALFFGQPTLLYAVCDPPPPRGAPRRTDVAGGAVSGREGSASAPTSSSVVHFLGDTLVDSAGKEVPTTVLRGKVRVALNPPARQPMPDGKTLCPDTPMYTRCVHLCCCRLCGRCRRAEACWCLVPPTSCSCC